MNADLNKNNFTAMILAAGYGTRLRPITDEIPKPLIPVGDRTLLENILLNIFNAGIADFAINTHHLSDMIAEGIEKSSWREKVTVFKEDEILGTGGPLVNAKAILSSGDGFLLHNGDIFTDIDLGKLIDAHKSDKSSLVTMVMVDGPENKVAVNDDGMVVDILGKLGIEGSHRLFTYAGIACFSQEIFDYLPQEPQNCSIISAILDLMRDKPESVAAFIADDNGRGKRPGPVWNDLGTVDKLIEAHKDIINGEFVLPDLSDGDMIRMPMKPLQRQGSDRFFFRLHENSDTSRIVMCASDDNADFERFIEIGNFLNSEKLGSAEIFCSNRENHTLIMEDLGDDTLYRLLKRCNSSAEVESLYRKVIEWLVNFQVATYGQTGNTETERIDKQLLHLRLFDHDYLRWETDYFCENFLVDYCGLDVSELSSLNVEFDSLADESLSHPQVMIHRDFQSQNILFENCELRIVDFQGARIGHIAYDLMSLVNDPYADLSKDLRNSLISYYFELLRRTSLRKCCTSGDEHSLVSAAALQRNMQALGAFAFLSIHKEKREYEHFIPSGLRLLKEVVEESGNRFASLKKVLGKL